MEKNAFDIIKEWIEQEDYVLVDSEQGTHTIRYQMNNVNIFPNNDDSQYCSVYLAIGCAEEDEPLKLICVGNAVTGRLRAVKAYYSPQARGLIIAYEFFYLEEDDLLHHLKIALEHVVQAKAECRKSLAEFNSSNKDESREDE